MNENEKAIIEVYDRLIEAWNSRNAEGMGELFEETGESIGFDGSVSSGKQEIVEHLLPIFQNHPTPPFITKVKEVKFIGNQTAILRAVAGMIPPGEAEINPELNTHHTLVVDAYKIELFQNTPAQFHGRPELVEEMTAELREQM